ncbi:S1C family serine protease [Halorussus pelagicus]|uniref:S1C family serine protease n=1 Tax=Halorussus pelagicus TaxID=2505977 RepID=UPI000FFCC26B|nr:trypsin-like peptidase domain-containing protein [Halorussus pelagicus]
MWGRTRLLVGVLVVALLGTGPVSAVGHVGGPGSEDAARQEISCDYEALYDETIGSIVSVRTATRGGQGLGSGFVYDDEGRVVTNQHVVGNASTVEVQFNRGEWRTAEVVGTDAYSDLAVLDVSDLPDYATPLELANETPEQGQPVGALGSPLGLDATITDGIVSGTNRSLPAGGPQGPQFTIPNAVQTTAAINPGNSGGPLVNCDGQVVGVNTATLARSENTGFAVPASRVERVAPSLIANGSYAHSYLGISSTDVTPLVAEGNDLNVTRGVLVRQVVPGGPADGALEGDDGITEVDGVQVPRGGDVILAIGGRQIRSGEELSSYLTQTRPGETVTLTVLRDSERTQVRVELGERPPPGESP